APEAQRWAPQGAGGKTKRTRSRQTTRPHVGGWLVTHGSIPRHGVVLPHCGLTPCRVEHVPGRPGRTPCGARGSMAGGGAAAGRRGGEVVRPPGGGGAARPRRSGGGGDGRGVSGLVNMSPSAPGRGGVVARHTAQDGGGGAQSVGGLGGHGREGEAG